MNLLLNRQQGIFMNKIFFIIFAATFLLSVPSIHAIDGAGPFVPFFEHRSQKNTPPSNRDPGDEHHDKKTLSGIAKSPVVMWDGTEVVPDPTTYPPVFTSDGVVMQNGVPVAAAPVYGNLSDGHIRKASRPPLIWDGVEVVAVAPTNEEHDKSALPNALENLRCLQQETYLKEREQAQRRKDNAIKGRIAKRHEQGLSSHL